MRSGLVLTKTHPRILIGKRRIVLCQWWEADIEPAVFLFMISCRQCPIYLGVNYLFIYWLYNTSTVHT